MFSSPQHYKLLADDKDVTEERDSAAQDMRDSSRMPPSYVVLIALVVSFILNTFFLIEMLRSSGKSAVSGSTAYAHLATDVAVAWTHKSPYWGQDEAAADQVWEDIGIDHGIVALPDPYVESMGLPTSVRFPLDLDKGIYVLNGFHSMHCLKAIRQAVVQFDRGLDRSDPTEHILHCLDALRQDVLCLADDTPRYTQPDGQSGTGQTRQCRSWSQLDAWAQQNTACWGYFQPHNLTLNPLERYQFCPAGSPYAEKAKEALSGL
ncbi:MAG: hypothetical protein LQ347_001764 [Umbilicaria vellea]|nr:MAG: hypothetical protein LQ347_001764 [Umbilicaria vellea]